MTREEAITLLRANVMVACDRSDKVGYDTPLNKAIEQALDMAIKALEQEPSDDVMAIHTQGLAEGIRCAMCTNAMKSDRGCDGGCVVDEGTYKKVMDTINNQMFSQRTSNDCVSREYLLDDSKYHTVFNDDTGVFEDVVYIEDIKNAPSVTPVACIATVKFSKEDMRELVNEKMKDIVAERKKGKWIKVTETEFGVGYKCSECGRFILTESVDGKKLKDYPYCHCGAEMESENV